MLDNRNAKGLGSYCRAFGEVYAELNVVSVLPVSRAVKLIRFGVQLSAREQQCPVWGSRIEEIGPRYG